MKKTLALLMWAVLTAGLISGCTGSPQKEEAAPAEAALEEKEAAASGEDAADSTVTDFGGETIVVGLYCGDDSVPGKDRIFKNINEYYMEKYNINVQFVTANMGDYAQSINMMLSSGEQMDIFSSGVLGFSNTVSNESTYDL